MIITVNKCEISIVKNEELKKRETPVVYEKKNECCYGQK